MFYAAQDLHTPAGKDAPSPNTSTAPVKKAGIGWEHWTSQIDDHLKPPTAAKRCTFHESRKSPAPRGFVAGRWALATTSLYPSTKIERPQRAPNRGPRGRFPSGIGCSGWPGSLSRNCLGQPHPAHGPTLSKYHRLHPHSENGTQGPHGRGRGFLLPARLVLEHARRSRRKVGVGHARKGARLPLAASQVLSLPHPRVGKSLPWMCLPTWTLRLWL